MRKDRYYFLIFNTFKSVSNNFSSHAPFFWAERSGYVTPEKPRTKAVNLPVHKGHLHKNAPHNLSIVAAKQTRTPYTATRLRPTSRYNLTYFSQRYSIQITQ